MNKNISSLLTPKKTWPCFLALFLFSFAFLSAAPKNPKKAHEFLPTENLGNYYYNMGEYALARIEFEREYRRRIRKKLPPSPLPQKIALSLMRQREFRKTLPFLLPQEDFASRYLSMYAALREGRMFQAKREDQKIQRDPNLNERQRELARLLSGSILLEYGDYPAAQKLYERLSLNAKDPEVRLSASQVTDSLKAYEGLETKSAILAGVFSAVLPGAGQFYTGFYVDGGVALFFNTMFLGSAIALYDLENQAGRPHQMSILTGIIGLGFYIANITGAVGSAHRYNNYYKRKFHEDIRRQFFNLDFVEKTSGIQFTERF